MVETVESRVLLATQPLVVASLGDSLTDEYQFYGPLSAASLGSLAGSSSTSSSVGGTDEVSNLLGILSSLSSATSSASAAITLPPQLFLTGRSSASNFVENLAENRSTDLTFGPFTTTSRGATREQGYAEDWALSGTTAAGFNYSSTGTTFAQEYEGYPNEFTTTGNQTQPGLLTQSLPASPYTIQNVNVVTILIGANDYAQAAENYVLHNDTAPLETQTSSGQWVINDAIETAIASAVSAIQAASPTTKIVLMTTPDITISPIVDDLLSAIGPFFPNLKSDIDRDSAALDTYLNTTYGNQAGVGVIDTQQLFNNFAQNPVIDGVTVNMTGSGQAYTDAFSGDGFHPGTILQGILAQAIVNEINVLFPGTTPAVTPLSDADIVNYAIDSQPAITFTSSAPTSTAGQAVTLSAQVTPAVAGGTAPTGTVTFEEVVTEQPNKLVAPFEAPGLILGTVPLSASGAATLTLPALPSGSVQIAAVYNGDPNFEAVISSELTQTTTTTLAATTTTLAPSVGVVTSGQTVTFTAIVSPSGTGQPVPTGTITFFDKTKNQVVGVVSLTNTGQASLSTSTLGVGTHAIVAIYGGNSDFAPSTSAPFSAVVNAVPPVVTASRATKTQLIATYLTVRHRRVVSFQVIVSPVHGGTGVPTGTVTVLFGANRVRTLVLNQRSATFVVPLAAASRRYAFAYYNGASPFLGSGSRAVFIGARPRPIFVRSAGR